MRKIKQKDLARCACCRQRKASQRVVLTDHRLKYIDVLAVCSGCVERTKKRMRKMAGNDDQISINVKPLGFISAEELPH